jgi:DNA-binding MarR family transcriptional regulator
MPDGKPLPISHAHALVLLRAAEVAGEGMTQTALARALLVDKSGVSRLCRRMEQAGHVCQRRERGDRRACVLALTPNGRRLAERVDAASRDRFGRLIEGVHPSVRARIEDALDALTQAAAELDSGQAR